MKFWALNLTHMLLFLTIQISPNRIQALAFGEIWYKWESTSPSYFVLSTLKISQTPTPKRKISSMKVCIMLGHRARMKCKRRNKCTSRSCHSPQREWLHLKEAKMSYLFGRISLRFSKFLDCEATSYLPTCTNVQMNQHEPALLWILDKKPSSCLLALPTKARILCLDSL
jgi:hypothetical protein